jgi:hypothetical protein
VNEAFADMYGTRVGHVFTMGSAPADPGDATGGGFEAGPQDRFRATVVGIGLLPGEIVQDDVDRIPRMIFTPAFTRAHLASMNYVWQGLRLRDGKDVGDFKRAITKLAEKSGAQGAFFQEQRETAQKVQRSVRPLAVSLAAFAGLVGLAMLLLVTQAFGRQLADDQDDETTMRAMGLGPVARAAPQTGPSTR